MERAQDKTLEDVQEMDDMRMGIRSQPSRKASAPASLASDSHMLHTAKGERRLREKIDREGGVENLSADEQGSINVLAYHSVWHNSPYYFASFRKLVSYIFFIAF